jgi:HK97 family phage major capsid protein
MTKYEQLVNDFSLVNSQANVILNRAQAENRAMNSTEKAEFNRLMAEGDSLQTEIDRVGQVSTGRQTQPQMPMAQAGKVGGGSGRTAGPGAPAGYSQFKSHGDFFQAVKNSCARGGTMDPRLIMDAPTTTSSEGAGADGGFMVPPQWSRDIFSTIMGEGSLVDLCNVVPVTSNSYVQVLDTGAPWAASGGIQAYWKNEESQLSQSKVDLKDTTKRLCKLTALVPVTEELLEDAPSLDGYLRRKVTSIFDFKINLAILQGVGTGQPSGILPAPCLITVDKEPGQDADTVVYENIVKMWGRLAPGSENNAVWLMHKDVWPQLLTVGLVNGVSSTPVFLPADAAAGRPLQTLMGRPIVTTQAAETLGDKGDILLCDLSQYQVILKTAGLRTDVSTHLWFDFSVLAYKFQIRIDGAPLWPAAVAARDGNSTYSPFVALAERS